MKFTLLISAIIICLFCICRCDIPTHCRKSQEVGLWEFKATKPIKKSLGELYKFSCGHMIPSSESTAMKLNMNLQTFTDKFTIELKDSDEALYSDANISGLVFIYFLIF